MIHQLGGGLDRLKQSPQEIDAIVIRQRSVMS